LFFHRQIVPGRASATSADLDFGFGIYDLRASGREGERWRLAPRRLRRVGNKSNRMWIHKFWPQIPASWMPIAGRNPHEVRRVPLPV
jgi:hypothetical protein